MHCKLCRRRVRDSFSDRFAHVWKYHPDVMLSQVSRLPDMSRTFGESIADFLKESLTVSKSKKGTNSNEAPGS